MLSGAFAAALGVQSEDKTCFGIARTTFTVGQIGMLDLAWLDANTLNSLVGSQNSSLVNFVAPSAGGIICGILAVALNTMASGARGKWLLCGEASALIIKASGNVARADRLCATTAKNLSPDHAAGDRVIAIAREPLTAPTAATAALVFFDGIGGLAQFVS